MKGDEKKKSTSRTLQKRLQVTMDGVMNLRRSHNKKKKSLQNPQLNLRINKNGRNWKK